MVEKGSKRENSRVKGGNNDKEEGRREKERRKLVSRTAKI